MDRTRYLIVGGGISGLSLARNLESPDYLICEALDDVGGYCATIKKDGFVWDYSGHFFHFRNKDIEKELVERIGPSRVRTVEKVSRIHFADKLIDFPFQKNIHQLPERDFYECLLGLVEKDGIEPTNFLEMLYSKFGKGITDKFLLPYNEKLYATDLAKLDVDAMGRFFPHADTKEIVRGFLEGDNNSYNSTFTYPDGGAIEYVRALAQDVPEERIRLNERVLSIDLKNKVATTSTGEVGFDYLISSIPFPRLLDACGVKYDPQIYSYNKVLVFNLGFDRKGPEAVHWIYYPQRELIFYRVGFYDNILNTERMSTYIEIGYPSDAPINEATIDAARERVLQDLKQVGVVDGHQLVAHHHVVLDPAYVHITQDSMRDVAAKETMLAEHGIHSMGRYGSWTYCSIEDNMIQAAELAKRLCS